MILLKTSFFSVAVILLCVCKFLGLSVDPGVQPVCGKLWNFTFSVVLAGFQSRVPIIQKISQGYALLLAHFFKSYYSFANSVRVCGGSII